jgi:hypothetical protein
MKITKVFVRYGRTFSLPGYSNVKPEVGYEAEIEPGEDVAAVKAELQQMAQAEVEEACDQALEAEGNSPRFWTGPKFNSLRVADEKYFAIVPAEAELPEIWQGRKYHEGRRLDNLRSLCAGHSSFTVADFSAGNVQDLPELRDYQVLWQKANGEHYCLILPGEFDSELLPGDWRSRFAQHRWYTRFAANVLAWITEFSKEQGATLIDCLDGDLSKLPDLAPPQPAEPDPFDYLEDEDPEQELLKLERLADDDPNWDEHDDDYDDDEDSDEEPSF